MCSFLQYPHSYRGEDVMVQGKKVQLHVSFNETMDNQITLCRCFKAAIIKYDKYISNAEKDYLRERTQLKMQNKTKFLKHREAACQRRRRR